MKKITVLIADGCEYDPFCARAKGFSSASGKLGWLDTCTFTVGEKQVTAVKTLVGKTAAASAAAYVCALARPDVMLNTGYSGAVSGFARGEFAVGSSYIECDFDISAFGGSPGRKPDSENLTKAPAALLNIAASIDGVRAAAFGTGDFFLADAKKKAEYISLFDIKCFDMESASIAWVCAQAGVPFISLRQMSDSADDTATSQYRDTSSGDMPELTDKVFELIGRS